MKPELSMIEMHPLFLFHRFTEKFKIDLFFIKSYNFKQFLGVEEMEERRDKRNIVYFIKLLFCK